MWDNCHFGKLNPLGKMKKNGDFRKNNRSGWDRQEQLWRGQKTKRPEPVRHKKKKKKRKRKGGSINKRCFFLSVVWQMTAQLRPAAADSPKLKQRQRQWRKESAREREREGETHERHREVENKNEGQKQVYVETESDKKMRGKTGMKMEQGRTGDQETEMIFFLKMYWYSKAVSHAAQGKRCTHDDRASFNSAPCRIKEATTGPWESRSPFLKPSTFSHREPKTTTGG